MSALVLVAWTTAGFGIGCVVTEISARRRVREERARYDSYIESHNRRLDDLEAAWSQRYAAVRARLGLPPRDQEAQ